MKHTDFFAWIRALKAAEYKELQAAVELHGGMKECREEVRFQPDEAFAGHLSIIIDYLPPVNGNRQRLKSIQYGNL